MKRIIKILLIFIFISGCVTTKFTSLEHFDKPTNYSRYWDNTVSSEYLDNYNNIWDNNGSFTLFADSLVASRLITKESFHFTTPFEISCEAKWIPANLALICPVWAFPLSDDKFDVKEFDLVEGSGRKVVMTCHIGENGYGTHKVYPKYIDANPSEWNKYRMKVTEWNAKWWLNGKLVHKVNFCKDGIGKRDYYLRISIIMTTRLQDNSLPDTARMDIRNLKVKQF